MAWADWNNFSTVTQYYVIEYNVIRFMVYDWENVELSTLNQMEIREKFWLRSATRHDQPDQDGGSEGAKKQSEKVRNQQITGIYNERVAWKSNEKGRDMERISG